MNWMQSLSYTCLISEAPGNNSGFFFICWVALLALILFFFLSSLNTCAFTLRIMSWDQKDVGHLCHVFHSLVTNSSIVNGIPTQTWAFLEVNRKHRLSTLHMQLLPLGPVLSGSRGRHTIKDLKTAASSVRTHAKATQSYLNYLNDVASCSFHNILKVKCVVSVRSY